MLGFIDCMLGLCNTLLHVPQEETSAKDPESGSRASCGQGHVSSGTGQTHWRQSSNSRSPRTRRPLTQPGSCVPGVRSLQTSSRSSVLPGRICPTVRVHFVLINSCPRTSQSRRRKELTMPRSTPTAAPPQSSFAPYDDHEDSPGRLTQAINSWLEQNEQRRFAR